MNSRLECEIMVEGNRKLDFKTENKAVYTAISVACGWAGAVMSLCKPRNSEICDQKLDDTDQRMDQLTNGPTSRLMESRSSN